MCSHTFLTELSAACQILVAYEVHYERRCSPGNGCMSDTARCFWGYPHVINREACIITALEQPKPCGAVWVYGRPLVFVCVCVCVLWKREVSEKWKRNEKYRFDSINVIDLSLYQNHVITWRYLLAFLVSKTVTSHPSSPIASGGLLNGTHALSAVFDIQHTPQPLQCNR